jgi:hypothetical protein
MRVDSFSHAEVSVYVAETMTDVYVTGILSLFAHRYLIRYIYIIYIYIYMFQVASK